MINIINTSIAQTNLSTEKQQAHGLGEQTWGCKGEGERMGWTRSLGLVDVNYLNLEWISNEVLLYTTGSYI